MTRSQDQSKSMKDRFQNSRRTQEYSTYFFRSNSSSYYQRSVIYSNNQSFYQNSASRQNDYRERFAYRNQNIRSYNYFRDNRFIDSRYFKKRSAEFVSVLSLTRQFLQIVDANANQNASDSSYSEIKSKNDKDYKDKNRIYVTKNDEHDNDMNESYDQEDEYYHESDFDLDYYDSIHNQKQSETKINFFTLAQSLKCRKCRFTFFSNNQLHKHLRQNICMKKSLILQLKFDEATAHIAMNISIVESNVDFSKNMNTEFEFRD